MKSLRCADAGTGGPACEVVLAPEGTPLSGDSLVRFRFGENARSLDVRDVTVGLEPMHDPSHPAPLPLAEVWRTGRAVQTGSHDGFQYSHDSEFAIATLQLDASRFADIASATRSAYVHLDALLIRLGYPHWLRVWNYLAHITAGEGDDERYRQFNAGRFSALQLKSGFEERLPAASAIGMRSGGFTLCCLASRNAGVPIENPRQVSAFRYPRQYGPRSPSFARATFVPALGNRLLVSGTASIVGHESMHADDTSEQLEETARNFRALVDHAATSHGSARTSEHVRAECMRVYVRDTESIDAVSARFDALFGADTPRVVLAGDICRPELALEVEGVYVLA